VRPRYARWIVIAAAAAAVLVAFAGRGDPKEPELVLRYLYSPDAKDLLIPLINRYNSEQHESGGREIRIDGTDLASGQAEVALAAGSEQAVLWTPASSLWGGLLNHSVSDDWVAADNPHLVFSPQVIAMWKTHAAALGPLASIGWKKILDLAGSPRGWKKYGRDYGPFRLGHTNPGLSTSGLSAVASHYYAVTGKSSLTLADVQKRDVHDQVRKIERSIVHQGETASKLMAKMIHYGPPYAHAVYVQETTLRGLKPAERKRLVWFTPADGTFVADYPLIVLAASWVSADARAAAEGFRSWLKPRITPKNAAASNFELRRPKGLVEREPPKPEVFAAIQRAWHEDRKPANIVVVLDTSNSMATDGRLEDAKRGLLSFLRALRSEDRVALVTSGDSIKTNIPLGVLGKRRPQVFGAVSGLFERGDKPVYAAVSKARDLLRARDDSDRINAVVVLSDGAGTTDAGLEELLGAIDDETVTEGTSVRVFTVGYGKSRQLEALRKIAKASDGVYFPADVKDVYKAIFSYF
jgi:Ca-activated chloride channel homolog